MRLWAVLCPSLWSLKTAQLLQGPPHTCLHSIHFPALTLSTYSDNTQKFPVLITSFNSVQNTKHHNLHVCHICLSTQHTLREVSIPVCCISHGAQCNFSQSYCTKNICHKNLTQKKVPHIQSVSKVALWLWKAVQLILRDACGYVTQEWEVSGFKLLCICSSAAHHYHSLTVETPKRNFAEAERAHVFWFQETESAVWIQGNCCVVYHRKPSSRSSIFLWHKNFCESGCRIQHSTQSMSVTTEEHSRESSVQSFDVSHTFEACNPDKQCKHLGLYTLIQITL